MVALSKTSENNSTPSFRSGLVTSTETLKLLLPASLEIEPPTASISFAICSAVRVFVPLSSTLAIKRVIPLVSAVSARRPLRKTAPIVTSGKRRSSRTRIRNPLESSNFCISPAAATVAENGREKIKRGNIRIGDLRNVPGQREMTQLGGKFLVDFAAAKLQRFRG